MHLQSLIVVGGIVAVLMLMTRSTWTPPDRAAPYLAAIRAAERRHGLPYNLLARTADQESKFRPEIINGTLKSSAGAIGILQIVPQHHPTVNPYDPFASIDYAAQWMEQLHRQFGDWRLVLAAYNAGPGNVKKYNGVPPFAETQAYVREIGTDIGLI